MAVVIICLDDEHQGQYLSHFNPDWTPEHYKGPRCGLALWSDDRAEAMEFVNNRAALDCYRTVSARQPVRTDGMPNRPLSAYTVEMVTA